MNIEEVLESERFKKEQEAFDELMESASPYHVMNWTEVNEGKDLMIEMSEGYGSLKKLARVPNLFHIVGDIGRAGVHLFNERLELTYYPPGTTRNSLFGYRIVRWEDMPYTLVSIPLKARRFAERVAEKSNLRLIDSLPCALIGGEPEPHFFPMQGPNVWGLAFAKGVNPGVIGPGTMAEMRRKESETIRRETQSFVDSNKKN